MTRSHPGIGRLHDGVEPAHPDPRTAAIRGRGTRATMNRPHAADAAGRTAAARLTHHHNESERPPVNLLEIDLDAVFKFSVAPLQLVLRGS